MITQAQIDALRAQRKPPEMTLSYQIGGPARATVHQAVDQARERQIQRGQQTLNHAVYHFRQEMAQKSQEGFTRSQFNHSAQPSTPEPAQPSDTTQSTQETQERSQ